MSASRPVEAMIQLGAGGWLTLRDPVRVVEARTPEGVAAAIGEVERLTRDAGYFAAGYLAFEAGAAFGLPTRLQAGDGVAPLAWFALFQPETVREIGTLDAAGAYNLGPCHPSLSRSDFEAAVSRIKTHLAEGDSYQVNFTFKIRAPFDGDPKALFRDLVHAQQGRYSAYLDTGESVVCSASPELFFAIEGVEIVARPMKGTARRGRTLDEDRRQSAALRESAKERAENVMIVDMMRNDLGKIAEVGSVEAPELFAAERYPNVWQMTSQVRARTRASLEDIFAALHPSASVTGAPKRRTLDIIGALEREARGVYTGAVGYVRPDGNGHFNVAIRTAIVAPAESRVEFGVGSGIVWDSDAASEYEECLLKGSVLGRRRVDFELLETTAWKPGEGFTHLERHLSRMREAAEYFGFAYAEAEVRAALAGVAAQASRPLRVRVLMSKAGVVCVETQPLAPADAGGRLRVALAAHPIDDDDPFLFHKTTKRDVYERARIEGVDDVILWNRRGEITEATTANVMVELEDGQVVTPPVSSGLLPGTARAAARDAGSIREQVIALEALKTARRIWLTNSVYGWREAVLVTGETS